MANYNRFLYDELGREYQRKNQYLLEVANLEEQIRNSEPSLKDNLKVDLKNKVKNRKNHPYYIELNKFKEEEKKFLRNLKGKKTSFIKSLDSNLSRKIKSSKIKLFMAEEKYNFYKKYKDLSYDAQLYAEENNTILQQIPEIIQYLEISEKKLEEAIREGKEIDKIKEEQIKSNLKSYKKEEKKIFKREIKTLKDKRNQGLISKKAVINGTQEFKNKYKHNIMLKSYESPKKSNKELIKNIKYEMNSKYKQNIKVLNANISDLRRNTPVEIGRKRPIVAYLTFLIPGLGQLLNRQYIKAALFFLVTLYTYTMAIPYALGYGNYQGQGIKGLITLAQGGLRIHKSLIFMIEGIIAVFLMIIGIFLFYLSFKDVLKVEKDRIIGIRERNWFESGSSIREEGFPYLVSIPAFIIIIFIVIVPVATTLLTSFTGMDPQHQSKFGWVGLANYELIALGKGLAGSVFWLILRWTLLWTLLSTTLAIIIGFSLALLVNNDRIKGKKFFRTIYLLPWAVPAFITIMFFSIMFSPNGAITEILNSILGGRIEVKNNTILTRTALICLQGWLGSSYVFLLSTGVLQSIPYDLHEAADIDGATSWKKTRKIIIPLVLFQTAPLLITQYTFNFNNFSIIHLFNGGGPFNPKLYGNLAGSSDLLISYIYKLTIENQYQAIGAAITIFISVGLMIFAYIGFRNSKGFKEGKL